MGRQGGRIVLWAGIAAGLFLGGCGDSGKLAAFLREPHMAVAATEYHVLPPDVIAVRSLYVPEINNFQEQVRPDGKINLPLLGEMYVANLTPHDIEKAIKEKAKDYYEIADATVTVVGYNSQRVYVFGQVSAPGAQPWTGRNTLLDVLAHSIPTTLAWPQRIRLIRGKPPTSGGYLPDLAEWSRKVSDESKAVEPGTEAQDRADADEPEVEVQDGEEAGEPAGEPARTEPLVMTVNLNKMIKSGDLSHNVLLEPDDIVYVPANPLAAIGLAIQQVLFPIRPAVETITVPAAAPAALAVP